VASQADRDNATGDGSSRGAQISAFSPLRQARTTSSNIGMLLIFHTKPM